MTEVQLYLLVAMAYGVLGAALSALYYFSPRLRGEPVLHVLTALIMLIAIAVATLGATLDYKRLGVFHLGAQFFLFFAASLCYVPVVVFLALHYWESLLEKITSPGSRRETPRGPETQREQWERIQAHLESLAADPTNVATHERLGDIYARMGFYDSAVYEYRKAADWLERGYAQGQVLYKAAHLLVEKKTDIRGALPILRRLVRLYPKSYFASYARRIINHYEAREGDGFPVREEPGNRE